MYGLPTKAVLTGFVMNKGTGVLESPGTALAIAREQLEKAAEATKFVRGGAC